MIPTRIEGFTPPWKKQLGLRLHPEKALIEVLVTDRLGRPTAD
jgi:uncharacterized protein (TIGR03435 family)